MHPSIFSFLYNTLHSTKDVIKAYSLYIHAHFPEGLKALPANDKRAFCETNSIKEHLEGYGEFNQYFLLIRTMFL